MSNAKLVAKFLMDDAEYYGQQINAAQLKMWVEDLSDLTPEEVLRGIRQNQKDETRNFPSKPAQIRSAVYNFPSSEEAWALIRHDEESSFVWCHEIAEAYAEVRHLVTGGDKISARMAFKDSYEKKIALAKNLKKRPQWFASLGSSKIGRDEALLDAIQKGRLSETAALSYSETLQISHVKSNQQLVVNAQEALQLTHNQEMSEEERQRNLMRTQEILQMLNAKKLKDESE